MERMPYAAALKLMDTADNRKVEVCGFVMEDWSFVFAPNISPKPQRSFEIHPGTQLRLVRERRNEIIGIFHSHPSGIAMPSMLDVQGWPAVPHWRYWIATAETVTEWKKEGHEFSGTAKLVSSTKRAVPREIPSRSRAVRRKSPRSTRIGLSRSVAEDRRPRR